MNKGKIFAGFALGALTGAALSCFAHSQRGHQLKKDIHKAIHDMRAKGSCCQACEEDKACECTDETSKKQG